MYNLKLIIDIEKDAWNRWNACNKISHGVDRKNKIDKSVYKNITGKTQEEAYIFLMPYLKNLYKINERQINNTLILGQKILDENINNASIELEKITGLKLYKENFIAYITTFPRGPYNIEEGSIMLYYNRSIKYYVGLYLHELLHFQFIYYYKSNPVILKLTSDQFEYLKESLTIILNHELKGYLGIPDYGYEIHKTLREKLDIFWKFNKNFDDLVQYGATEVKKII